MIYLQSRLLLLSGNKKALLYWLFFWVLFFCSCSAINPSRSAQTKAPQSIPNKDSNEAVEKVKLDTLKWVIKEEKQIKEEPHNYTKIEDTNVLDPRLKDIYRVGVLLPLYSDNKERVLTNDNIKSIMHFYLGMQMALMRYNKGNPKIIFDFVDIESKDQSVSVLISGNKIKEYDLVIGPYKTVDIQAINEYCAAKQIPVISPWNPASSAAGNNTSYIQLKPSLRTHASHIANYIADYKKGQKVFIIANEKDEREIENFKFFRDATANKGIKIQEILLNSSIMPSKHSVLKEIIETNQEAVIIIPYFTNWEFVSKVLSSVLNDYLDRPPLITFIGLPQMIENENVGLNLLDKLNVMVSVGPFFDLSDEKVQRIRASFFERYRAIPLEEAYYGHDIANWVVNHIIVNGTEFNPLKSKKVRQFGVNSFELNLEFGDKKVSDDFKNYSHLENHALQMVRLVDYKFQKSY